MRDIPLHVVPLLLAVVGPVAAGAQTPQYGDSTTFDPDGYYVPATDVIARRDTVLHFEVRTVEYYYDGALHYERPRLLPPRANVLIARAQGGRTRHECRLVAANRDQLSLACETPLGQLTLETTYADKRGRYWNIIDYELGPRVVAKGRLLIQVPGRPPDSRHVDLVYTAGH